MFSSRKPKNWSFEERRSTWLSATKTTPSVSAKIPVQESSYQCQPGSV
jgi:hypothetical protein